MLRALFAAVIWLAMPVAALAENESGMPERFGAAAAALLAGAAAAAAAAAARRRTVGGPGFKFPRQFNTWREFNEWAEEADYDGPPPPYLVPGGVPEVNRPVWPSDFD